MNSEKVSLNISGMKCGGCVSAVEEALKAVDGVESVNVSLADKNATVTGAANSQSLTAAVESAGFKAEVK